MPENDSYGGWYFASNLTNVNVVYRDLDLNLQGQTVQVAILMNKDWKDANITVAIGQKVMCTVEWRHCGVVHYDFDLRFQGHEFLNVNISKTVRTREKCSGMTFIEVDICHRIRPLRLLDLGLSFQGHTFAPLISRKRWELSQDCVSILGKWRLPRFKFAIEWNIVNLTSIFKVKYFHVMYLPRLARPPPWSCSCYNRFNRFPDRVAVCVRLR